MKLSNVFAKLTFTLKSNVVRVLAAATLAGGMLAATAPAAEAQHFGFGVRIGGPVIVERGPVYRGYYEPYRYDPYWRYHHDRFYRGYYR